MASASPSELVTSSTGYLMLRLGEFLRERTEILLRRWDLSARDLRVLGFAAARAMSQRELAETAGLDRTTMVGVLDRLESIGYARRERDEHDRRRFLVAVTEAGARTLEQAVAELATAQADFLAPFTPEERRQFHAMVERLFRAHDPSCDPA
ncbi:MULTISPECIES: MarR family winged helix-turn-helix transcriptional regulator [unclassified Nocardia]|uniref:MarR family winged helix-turn-helix transcriptional regulator n=1 Tax=unclassified Nocardia TaxID=2637762 RepID=UPI00278BD1C1|nr:MULTISPECIES: MarR family transcriptional regulator [unclassified Nocardia]